MSSSLYSRSCFKHGRVVISPGVIDLALRGRLDVLHYFTRHRHGDWGKVPLVYGVMNEFALRDKKRLFSEFDVAPGVTLWIFTRLDRSVTTLLLPHESESFKTELTA